MDDISEFDIGSEVCNTINNKNEITSLPIYAVTS